MLQFYTPTKNIMINTSLIDVFGNKLRIRVCGILIENDNILLIKHKSITQVGSVFWAPPGGGLVFGESVENALKREFLEETGLVIDVVKMLFVNEFLKPPLHAIELFFEVSKASGILKIGFDPEMNSQNQIIEDVCFVSLRFLSTVCHLGEYHGVLKNLFIKPHPLFYHSE